jgi:hypothetical protein
MVAEKGNQIFIIENIYQFTLRISHLKCLENRFRVENLPTSAGILYLSYNHILNIYCEVSGLYDNRNDTVFSGIFT